MTSPANCFHCGQAVPTGIELTATIEGQSRVMCCRGCQAVAQAIEAGGLGDYYHHRTQAPPTAREAVPSFLRQNAVYDNPTIQQSFVKTVAGSTREAALILEGIVCAACVWLNEQHLSKLPGVQQVAINYSTHRARICWDDSRIHLSQILNAVTEIGYLAHPYDPHRAQEVLDRERRVMLRRLAVAAAFGMQIMVLAVALYAGAFTGIEDEYRNLFHWLSLVLVLPILGYSSQPFFRSAFRDLRRHRTGMDVPVSLGLGIAFAGSIWATVSGAGEVYFDSVAMFVFFLLTGRYFELAGRKRAAEVSEALVHMLPTTATRMHDSGEVAVPVGELTTGDRVLIRPGESIPADGTVLDGRSSVDESLLTGESLPVAKHTGAALTGGSINMENPLVMRVEKTGAETVLSAILRLLDRAQTEKPAIAQTADRAAGWFVARVLLLAVGVALFWIWHDSTRWLPITLAVLVVSCPCALSLATPTAITAATGRLMRRGLVVTRGHALETLARANVFVFDKTGTLTHGHLHLIQTHALADVAAEQCLKIASALEQQSEHPIAHALRTAMPDARPARNIVNTPGAGLIGEIDSVRYLLGTADHLRAAGIGVNDTALAGLRAHGNTVILLADAQQLLAAFEIGDELRTGARELVTSLQRLGMRVLMLTGDHATGAQRVADACGITEFAAGLKPDEKLKRIRQFAAEGNVVAMVGDGINDAAAMAAAHVSIAMGGGTQLAASAADMILLSGRLPHLADGVTVAVRTVRIIRQNMAWAVGYNLTAVPFAALGYVAPWMAALGMSLSSLLVVANALRLRDRTD